MNTLFSAITINGMELANRLVRSATWEGMCDDDGSPSPRLVKCYKELAAGGVGLIITGYTYVRPDGKELPGKMGMHHDGLAPAMAELTGAVHGLGGKICVQLVHAGGQTRAAMAGRQPVAPSAVQVKQFPEMPAQLTTADIDELVECFGQAARRAKAWGFDAIQIHGAHGYLINQFLSAHTNQRGDDYGGSLEKRCRFLQEVYARVRQEVGPDYPVLLKLNGADFVAGGLSNDEAVAVAKVMDGAGIDGIEVSGGTTASGKEGPIRVKIKGVEQEAYNLALARPIKEAVACPVLVVGGMRSFEVVERAIDDDGMDLVALARPLIREPDLARRWQQGDRAKAKCISCNGCFKPGLKEGGIACVVARQEQSGDR
ncbi:MAG: NADH:flavin oxidoreductase [Thermodesulfobacteriota bacterium]